MKLKEYVGQVLNEGKRNPKAQKYYEIVFMQGDEAKEPLKILDDKGEAAAIKYLSDWDYGKEMEHTEIEKPWGPQDDTYEQDDYVLSYNTRLGYIGLVRRVKEENEEGEKTEKESYIDATGRTINEEKTAKVKMFDSEYEIEIMDGTHLKMKPVGSDKWGTPLHFNQVRDEVIEQLKEKGLVNKNRNFFVMGEAYEPGKKDLAANAIRDMFLSKQYDKKVPAEDIKNILSNPKWHRAWGEKELKDSWQELQDDGYVTKEGKFWVWGIKFDESKQLGVPETHQKNIALKTLKMSKLGAKIMGGMDHKEAVKFLKNIGYKPEKVSNILKLAGHKEADVKEFMEEGFGSTFA